MTPEKIPLNPFFPLSDLKGSRGNMAPSNLKFTPSQVSWTVWGNTFYGIKKQKTPVSSPIIEPVTELT